MRWAPQACPRCLSPKAIRRVKSGEHVGKESWVCRAYPDCKWAMPVREREEAEPEWGVEVGVFMG